MDMLKAVLPTIVDLAAKLDCSIRIRGLQDEHIAVVTDSQIDKRYFSTHNNLEALYTDNTLVKCYEVCWVKTSKLYKRRQSTLSDHDGIWWHGRLEFSKDHILYSHRQHIDSKFQYEKIDWGDPQCWDIITKILTLQVSSSEDLRAMVQATNAANAEANRLDSELKTHFVQFVSKKVLKKDGSLMARIVARMPSLPNEDETLIHQMIRITEEHRHEADVKIDLRCRHKRSRKSLCFRVTASAVLPDGFCLYSKSTVTVGELQDGVLVSVHPRHDYRTDYTCEEIQAKRDKVAKAKKALDVAKSALYPFEEYDR